MTDRARLISAMADAACRTGTGTDWVELSRRAHDFWLSMASAALDAALALTDGEGPLLVRREDAEIAGWRRGNLFRSDAPPSTVGWYPVYRFRAERGEVDE